MSYTLITKLIAATLAYFAPIAGLIHLVMLLVLVDFITGIYASVRSKDAIVSHRLRKTLEKFVFYAIAVMIARGFSTEITSFVDLPKCVAGFVAAVETLSVFENISKITGVRMKYSLPKVLRDLARMNKKEKQK